MTRIPAIAAVTVRGAIRSRVLVSLLAVLALVIVGLPLSIKGDGTVGGMVQVLLSYTLEFAGLILALAIVWAGCGAVSLEVRDRQIHLIMVKPVTALELWAGKWLGLVVLLTVLHAAAGAGVYGMLRWTTRAGALSADDRVRLRDEILVARRAIAPQAPDIEGMARARFESEREAGRLPAHVPVEQAYAAIRAEARAAAFGVAPSGRRAFTYEIPAGVAPDRPAHLRFRFVKSILDFERVAGNWTVAAPGGAIRFEAPGAWRPGAVHAIEMPGSALAGLSAVEIAFENRDPAGAALYFDPDDGLRLLVHRGGFLGNYVRALLTMLLQAALLAAIGLTAGSLLSMPVASFAALAVVLATRLSGAVAGMARDGPAIFLSIGEKEGWALAADRVYRGYFIALQWLTAPLRGTDALDRLSTGQLVGWGEVARMGLSDVVIGCGLFAILGAWLFRRRELGAAQG
jgi:ABC-type transport system involved in multi-copper enzyme maturation permease subunit